MMSGIYETWRDLLGRLIRDPHHVVAPRGHATRERLAESLTIDLRANIIVSPSRNVNHRFMVAEWLWVAFGRSDVETIARYNSRLRRFSDDGVTLAGAYGPRFARQIYYVLETLRRDPASRQAVLVIWTPTPAPSKDIPCTIALQFLLRDKRLHAIATMRSSDVWLGVPYDVFTFSMLANAIAGELMVDTGSLTMQLGSSHLYDENLEAAERVLAESNGATLRSPILPGFPSHHLQRVLVDNNVGYCSLDEPWTSYGDVLTNMRMNAVGYLERVQR